MDAKSDLIGLLKGLARPDVDDYFLMMAVLASTRGTCGRRRVGCVLVDRHNHVLATGYNGVASGVAHCTDVACPGRDLPSGTGLDKCEALHAEENALIQCTRPNDIDTVYSMASPCIHCVRRLMNTAARRIVFAEVYPHPESELLWTGRSTNADRFTQLSRGKTPDGLQRKWIHRPLSRSTESTPAETSVRGPVSSKAGCSVTDTPSSRAGKSPGSRTRSS